MHKELIQPAPNLFIFKFTSQKIGAGPPPDAVPLPIIGRLFDGGRDFR